MFSSDSFKRHSRYDPDSDDILSPSQMQYGYTPDTAVILLLVQTSANLVRTRYAPGMEAILFLIQIQLSITVPNGIYKPISDKVLSHLQMASVSPSSYPSVSKWHL